jgi:hypothetical protein
MIRMEPDQPAGRGRWLWWDQACDGGESDLGGQGFQERSFHRHYLALLAVCKNHLAKGVLEHIPALIVDPSLMTSGHSTSWPM